jgi:hypothetical protein
MRARPVHPAFYQLNTRVGMIATRADVGACWLIPMVGPRRLVRRWQRAPPTLGDRDRRPAVAGPVLLPATLSCREAKAVVRYLLSVLV